MERALSEFLEWAKNYYEGIKFDPEEAEFIFHINYYVFDVSKIWTTHDIY